MCIYNTNTEGQAGNHISNFLSFEPSQHHRRRNELIHIQHLEVAQFAVMVITLQISVDL